MKIVDVKNGDVILEIMDGDTNWTPVEDSTIRLDMIAGGVDPKLAGIYIIRHVHFAVIVLDCAAPMHANDYNTKTETEVYVERLGVEDFHWLLKDKIKASIHQSTAV